MLNSEPYRINPACQLISTVNGALPPLPLYLQVHGNRQGCGPVNNSTRRAIGSAASRAVNVVFIGSAVFGNSSLNGIVVFRIILKKPANSNCPGKRNVDYKRGALFSSRSNSEIVCLNCEASRQERKISGTPAGVHSNAVSGKLRWMDNLSEMPTILPWHRQTRPKFLGRKMGKWLSL